MSGRPNDDDKLSLRTSYYASSRDSYRHHDRAQSAHIPLKGDPSDSRGLRPVHDYKQIRSQSHPLSAFVEDERDALLREHNPALAGLLSAASDQPIVRGEIDQVPILIEIEENFERRFVLIPKSPNSDTEPLVSAETHPTQPSTSKATENPAATTDKKDSILTPSDSPLASGGLESLRVSTDNGRRIERPSDRTLRYEANTCRKFTVPRIESDAGESPSISEPMTNDSKRDDLAAAPPLSRPRRSSSIGTTTAALSAAAAAATIAAASTPSKAPEINRRKSRFDLSRIETDVQHDERAPNNSTDHPRSSTFPEHRSRDRHRDSQDARDKESRDRRDVHDNIFLSPSLTKYSSNGRDHTYFDHDRNHALGGVADSGRASSGDVRRSQRRVQRRSTSSDRIKHRSTSFSATDRLRRQPSYKRTSKDEAVSLRAGRRSPSLSPKSHNLPFSPSRTEKRAFSPSRNRNREHEILKGERGRETDWITQRDKERERERERAREREERLQREERKAERERERRERELRERDKEICFLDQDLDRKQSSKPETVQKKRRDLIGQDGGHLSDERTNNATANMTLRRQNSDRRRSPPAPKNDESIVNKASSNPDPRRSALGVDPDTSTGRYQSESTTPHAIPKRAQSQFPFIAGSPPKDLFEAPYIVSSSKKYRGDGRRKEGRRLGSPPSPSTSPDARSVPYNDSDRPKGPRPRAPHLSNIVHNSATPSSSMPSLQADSRASRMSLPIPIPIPVPPLLTSSAISHEIGSGKDWDGTSRHERRKSPERRRSPVDKLRGSNSSLASARASDNLQDSASMSQSYRQPAFFINIPNSAPAIAEPADVHFDENGDDARKQLPEQILPANNQLELPPPERQLIPTYEKFAEDISNGHIPDLRQCPRINFTTRYRDWRTLTPFKDFLICPTCYESQFANTMYRNEFVHATEIDPNVKANCVYGAMLWYNVAYFYTRAFKKTSLALLRTMFKRDEELRLPCSGPMRVPGRWFTVQDPVTARPVNKFTTCEQCTTAISVLFPRLNGILQDNNPTQHDTTNICSLYYEPERKRLWKYIGVLESVNNEAAETNLPVDVNDFINKILDVSRYDECKRDIPVRGRKWYWMRTIPNFVVCQECFEEAVYPVVNTYRSVAGDFYKEPKELAMAACHLYSKRMRDIFLRSCQANDKDYLQQKLQEREDIAADITNQIKRLPEGTARGDLEQSNLLAEWRKWE